MKEKLPYLAIVIIIAIFIGTLQINKIEPFESFSLRFNDSNFIFHKKINKDIVFVAVDEKSVNRFGRWPWKREIIAKGIDNLQEADLLLLDMIFSEPTDTKSDDALAESILNLDASVCGFFLRQKSTQTLSQTLLDILDDSSLDKLQSQIAEFTNPHFIGAPYAEVSILPISQSCTLSGSFSTLPESDKLLRSYPVAVYFNNKLFPSLAIQALRLKYDSDITRFSSNELSINNNKIKVDEKGFVKLNFYKKEQYKIVSFLDVIEKKVKPEYFKDKIVLLGITEVGVGDVVSTPVGAMYGPLLHYTFLSNFLEKQLIVENRSFNILLTILMIILPFFLILFTKNILKRIFITLIVYGVLFAFVKYIFISKMLYLDLFYPLIGLLLSTFSIEGFAFNREEKNTRFIKEAFSAYLSKDLLKQLLTNPQGLCLGGEDKELSILFSDIRGFTTISESMDAHSLVSLLNKYFTPMTDSVLIHEGMLDKYIGDAVMAFFNAPVDVKNHADQACLCALDMVHRLETLNRHLQMDESVSNAILPIKIGIGINTASVVVGNIGSGNRFNYTVMGDGVNISSRVEGITKEYGVSIIITEFTLKSLKNRFIYRELQPVVLKGKDSAVLLYELMPDTKSAISIQRIYNDALILYKNDETEQAKQLFTTLVERYNDGPAQYFLNEIEENRSWQIKVMRTK